MPNHLLKNRIAFFTVVTVLQVTLHVAIGLSMYAVYQMARYLLLKAFEMLPNRLVANLWQVGLLFVVLG